MIAEFSYPSPSCPLRPRSFSRAEAAARSSNTSGVTPDSGTAPDSSGTSNNPDSSSPVPDSGEDSAGQSSVPDGGVAPQGTLLLPSDNVAIDGVTDDELLIYTDTNANKIYSMPLAGGASTLIGPVDGNNDALVPGKLVLFQETSTNGIVRSSVWRSGGHRDLARDRVVLAAGAVIVSSDDSSVLLFDNVPASFATADLIVEHTDGSNKTTVAAGLDIQSQICQPAIAFGGTTAFAAVLPARADGGRGDGGFQARRPLRSRR